ncbi:enoyl-CoA hydratase-related protein, partial [Mycobacterium colombiense]|uniref:enoyl-CoA hydratase-related protein n=1 Tax=Mycobacterium colombiense TaxID=339268 RepID=UPI00155FBF94
MSTDLTVEIDSGVAVLTLNRPDHLNAYTAEMGELLGSAYPECAEHGDVRAIVLTGARRA